MEQVITSKLKLFPTKEQVKLLEETTSIYISTINKIIENKTKNNVELPKSTTEIISNLPSCLKNQIIIDSKSIVKKIKKTKKIPVLKKPVAVWNNQNYDVIFENNKFYIRFNIILNGKSKKINILTKVNGFQQTYLNFEQNKKGTLRITKKSNGWFAQISITTECDEIAEGNNVIMGIDLGLKVPAVAVTSDNKTKFFGNGRQNKFIKRKYKSLRKQLGKKKLPKKIKEIGNKEQRWMANEDHKISKQIVNFAVSNNVAVIRLEELFGIRQTAKTSRKNNRSLHNWSFFRLSNFIHYKASRKGIVVEYVNPAYTSQICPQCKNKHKANDRKYKCPNCGFTAHRDKVGAINIIKAPIISGNSLLAVSAKSTADGGVLTNPNLGVILE